MTIEIEVKLYGTFRKYEEPGKPIRVQADRPIRVSLLKEMLTAKFKELFPKFADSELIHDSAIANESQVLRLDHVLSNSCTLLILPPVCGG
jgi:molybdopterin converting factor small subunit